MDDLASLTLFLMVYYILGVNIAVSVLLFTESIIFFSHWIREGIFPFYRFWSRLAPILLSGALTLAFADLRFLQYKASVIYAIFGALSFAHSSPIGREFIKNLKIDQIGGSKTIWLMNRLGCVFLSASALNILFIQICSFESWMFAKIVLSLLVTCVIMGLVFHVHYNTVKND
ncbi:MAG: hypothetical protein FJ161_04545 [Gammaproteobacteria bacterium]|nr:hypothetical protein [Gammaproteobacteria bacterium]